MSQSIEEKCLLCEQRIAALYEAIHGMRAALKTVAGFATQFEAMVRFQLDAFEAMVAKELQLAEACYVKLSQEVESRNVTGRPK